MMEFPVNSEEIVELASSLISRNTTNPPGNEYRVKEIILSSLKELNASIEIIGEEKRPNILGFIGEGKPIIGILAHMDVVPAGEGWHTPPFSPVLKEGKLYGRGAIDDKGPYACAWQAVKALLKTSKRIKGTIILGAVADEERGSEKGVKLLLQKGFKADFCLIPDGGNLEKMIIGEKGLLWIGITCRGKSAHASTPEKGVNAILKTCQFLEKIKRIKWPSSSPYFTPPTLNVGKIEGGEAPNIVPSLCKTIIDIRYPLGLKKEEILSLLRKISEGIPEVQFSWNLIEEAPPHLVNTESFWIKKFEEAAREEGIKIKKTTQSGFTVAKLLNLAGIPSISHLPEKDSTAHQANEFVTVENLVKCARIWARFLNKVVAE